MIIINVNGNIERALKDYKKKIQKIKQIEQLRDNQAFEKPSITRRIKMKKAIYTNLLKQTNKL